MSTTTLSAAPGQAMAANPMKPLWIAIGVLGTAVLVMAATVVQMHKQSTQGQAQGLMSGMNVQAMTAPALSAPTPLAAETANTVVPTSKSLSAQESVVTTPATKPVAREQRVVSNTSSAPARQANPATPANNAPVVSTGYPPVASTMPTTQAPPVQAQAKPVCATCGTVESVTPITRDGEGTGIGAVTGGVLGGVLGNQIGKGSGRTAGTIIGAVGGGVAGHHIEKKVRKETVYSVVVRMEDGSNRTLQQKSAPAVGSKVTVEGGTIRSADGATYGDATRTKRAKTQPTTQQPNIGGDRA